jgi:alpha-glucosidase
MQWSNSANAGFTTGSPWLPVPDTYKTHNVADEEKDPDSIWNFYRRVLSLRHQNRALLDGDYVALNENDPNVISYLRRYKNEAVFVAINMSGSEQKVSFDLKPQGFGATKAATLVTTEKQPPKELNLTDLTLKPFGVYIASVAK